MNAYFILAIGLFQRIESQVCNDQWQYLQQTNSCYRVFTGLSVTFGQAQTYCVDQQSNAGLASISSTVEQNFLMSLCAGIPQPLAPWIGSQLLVGGLWVSSSNHTFIWSNGVPWTNFAGLWAPNEPDNQILYAPENCTELMLFPFGIVLSTGALNDSPCQQEYANIACMAPSMPTTPTTSTATSTAPSATSSSTTSTSSTTTVSSSSQLPTTASTTSTAAASSSPASSASSSPASSASSSPASSASSSPASSASSTASRTSAATGSTSTTSAAVSSTTRKTATTPTTTNTCCPSGGIWSPWKASNCSDTCGGCGEQNFTRSCTSKSNNCPCTGLAMVTMPCNAEECDYPRRTCCGNYTRHVVNNKNVCGPMPVLNTTYAAAKCQG